MDHVLLPGRLRCDFQSHARDISQAKSHAVCARIINREIERDYRYD